MKGLGHTLGGVQTRLGYCQRSELKSKARVQREGETISKSKARIKSNKYDKFSAASLVNEARTIVASVVQEGLAYLELDSRIVGLGSSNKETNPLF